MRKTIFYLFFVFLGLNLNAQLIIDDEGDVGIGNRFGGIYNDIYSPVTLEVQGQAYIKCGDWDGFYFGNMPNQWGFSTPVFRAKQYSWWTALGRPNLRFAELWMNHITTVSLKIDSDVSIKENIRPLKTSLEKILNINPVQYDIKKDFFKNANPKMLDKLVDESKNQIGVIAQELQEVVPDLVKYNEESEMFSVNYIGLIPILIKAMQEQQEQIELLKKEIKILKGRK